jgi:hypothetical protein
VLGGLGLLLVFGGGSLVAARTWGTREPTESPPPVYDPEAKYLSLQWVVAVAIGFVLLRICLMRGWLDAPQGAAYIFFDIGLYGVTWIVAFAGLCWIARGGWTGDIDVCQVACLAGALAFLLHGLIDFAMFSPGTLMPFAGIAGLLVTDKPHGREPVQAASHPALPVVVVVTGAAVFAALVLLPVTRANSLLNRARFGVSVPAERWNLFEAAMRADPLDPTAPVELALTFVGSGGDIPRALEWLNEGVQRDPKQVGLYRGRAGLLEASFRRTGSMVDLLGAIGASRQVISLYPESPDDHLTVADMLARNAEVLGEGAVSEAVVHYQQALALDAARRTTEIRRWPERRRRSVEERLVQLIDMASSRPTESSPATEPQG